MKTIGGGKIKHMKSGTVFNFQMQASRDKCLSNKMTFDVMLVLLPVLMVVVVVSF